MKIIVIHGDNVMQSYNRLQKFIGVSKSRDWEIKRTNSGKLNIKELLGSDSLFQKEKLVIADDIRLFNKNVFNWLKKRSDIDTTLVIYHGGTLNKTFLNSLPKNYKVEEFKLPKLIWSFLESFYPGNARNCLLILHQIVGNESIEFVFSLLAKHMRDVYWAKIDNKSMSYPSWRIEKLQRQAQRYTLDKLKLIINEFADADIKSKTSDSNLSDLLDFITATKLE